MAPIATFVFFDLETTGLPQEELNKTKITELSFVAVKRSHILESQPGGSPRVQQKLTLCFNPRRIVQPVSTKITGLCNDLLENESPFNEAAFNTISSFLKLLSKPVCLVAHNGMTYDYPILKKHLTDLNVNLSEDLLCADCLYCFYDIDTKVMQTSNLVGDKEATLETNVVYNEDLQLHHDEENLQKQNESTPKKLKSDGTGELNGPKKRKCNTNPMEISKARRRIFFNNDPKPQKPYKLHCIYERYLNRSPNSAHRAENDCIMALECSVAKAEKFVQWIDNNHCLFSDVKAMSVGVPLGY